MAGTYFLIGPTLLKHASVSIPVVCNTGDIVKYDHEPGTTMVAIDAEAATAKARARAGRSKETLAIDDRLERRMLARLPRSLTAKLAALEAEVAPKEAVST
jgi:hypothetical protein